MNASNLTPVEKIEYYLGKDRLPNLHWQARIPNTWDIPPKISGMSLVNSNSYSTTITLDEGIPYRLNNLGYRSMIDYDEQLYNKDLILAVGDSDTFARGVEFDQMYSSHIQKNTGYTVLNLGIPGISSDGAARVAVQSMLALKSAVKHVCVLWPIFSLREFVSKTFQCGTHAKGDHVPYKDWYQHIDWVSNNYNYQKNRMLIKHTAEAVGAQFHDLIINRADKNNNITYITVRSAGSSFTELDANSHEAIANYFVRQIHNQPSLFEQVSQS